MLARLSHGYFHRHPAQVLLALVGIAAGIAVVTGVALLRASLMESLDAVSTELAGDRAVTVRHASGRLPIDDYARLARLPGAPDLVPVLRLGARAGDQRIELVGLDPYSGVVAFSETDDAGLAGALFDDDPRANVVASAATLALLGVAPGDGLKLKLGEREVEVQVAAAARARPGLDRRLLLDISELQALSGERGWLSELVAPAGAEAWLQQRLGDDLMLITADAQRAGAGNLTRGMRANLTAMSLLALATGLFVVFSVLSFLMVQRRKTFGLLRALGLTHPALARMLVGEVLLIAAFGGLLGLVVGTLLADRLLMLLARPVAEVYGQLAPAATDPSLALYLVIFLAGLVAAALVTVPVLREAVRIPPGRLVRSIDRPGWPLARALTAALALALVGLVWVLVDGRLVAALGGLFLVLAGAVILIPALGFGLIGVVARHFGRTLAGRALGLLKSARARLAPALSALSLALALAIGMGMMILGFRDIVGDWVVRLLQADLYVSIEGRPMSGEEHARLAALDGVRSLSSVRRVRLADGMRLTAYDLDPESWAGFEMVAGDAQAVWPDFDAGNGVILSEPLARRTGLTVGDTLRMIVPVGPVSLPVLAVFRDYSSEQGFVGLPRVLYDDWYGDGLHDSVGVYLAPGLEATTFAAQLDALSIGGIQWITPPQVQRETLAVFDRTFRISWALALLVGLIALVALTSALLAQGLERSREHATLRALGLPPAGLFRLVTLQSAGLTAVALLAALPLALLIHVALSLLVQPRAFGWSLPLGVPPLEPMLWVVPLALIAGTLTGLYPAWRIVRRPMIDHLRAGR
ncbi:MAG: FtsX-like permease family protein [Wenzhouxiangellaceae bacterium]|nr:FtsX-like permease family protein [Wenzhouxiangellaceae bacterium]